MSSFLKRLLVLTGLALALSGGVAHAADETIIYPRSSDAAGKNATSSPAPGSAGNTGILLCAVLLAGVGGWFIWKQRTMGGFTRSKVPTKLTIAETKPLGNRQFLVVATYEDQKFLLSVCPGRIELLTKLDGKASDSNAASS